MFSYSNNAINLYRLAFQDADGEIAWAVVNMFSYSNNATNFLLYCVSGSKFRNQLRKLFCISPKVAPVVPAGSNTGTGTGTGTGSHAARANTTGSHTNAIGPSDFLSPGNIATTAT